jgi:hypothetical protein
MEADKQPLKQGDQTEFKETKEHTQSDGTSELVTLEQLAKDQIKQEKERKERKETKDDETEDPAISGLRWPETLSPLTKPFALVQFISEIGSERLPEPVLIVINFFATLQSLETYAAIYIEDTNASTQWSPAFPVEIETWKTPYVDSKNVGSRIYPKSQRQMQKYYQNKKEVQQEMRQKIQKTKDMMLNPKNSSEGTLPDDAAKKSLPA